MFVSQILKSKPGKDIVTITPDKTVADAAALLAEKGIGAVLVTGDGDGVVGILSERDIVRALGRTGTGCLEQKVAELMTSSPEHCARGDQTHDILQRMTNGRFRHMPVLEEGKLAGIISIGDVVKARLDELSTERDALEDMIRGF